MPTDRSTDRTAASAPHSPSPDSVVVRSAVPADLAFVVMLQKAHAAALGFLPRVALGQKIQLGQVLVARGGGPDRERGSRAGFLHHGSLKRPEVRVFQIAVLPDVRCGGVGRALVERMLERARDAGAKGVSLRCLAFLEANRFWRALGFRLHATEPGARGTLNVWVRRLGRGGRFEFASRVHPCPGCNTPTVDTWVRGARRSALCPGCIAAASSN